jgi:hypothetical protein
LAAIASHHFTKGEKMKKTFLPLLALLLFVGFSGNILAQTIEVSGGGSAAANGTYTYVNNNGKNYYAKPDWTEIYWETSYIPPSWRIVTPSGYGYYYHTANTSLPPAGGWQVDNGGASVPGLDPPPTLTGDVDPLPVELNLFTASAKGTTAELRWSTATEVNSYGFDVERRTVSSLVSTNVQSSNWTKIGFVQANGTSNSPHDYSYADRNLAGATYGYRLKQIDKGGGFKYLQETEVTVVAPNIFSLAQNYPDPFNPTTTIQFTVPSDGRATLRIFNVLGQEVATLFEGVAAAGEYHRATFDASRLASGIYFSRLEFDGKMQLKKMVLLK